MSKLKKDDLATIQEKMQKAKDESKSFYELEELLKNDKTTDEKKKLLWNKIYKNAMDDRDYSLMLFTEVYQTMAKSSSDHIALSATLAKYLERMSKANQQIIELSNLINSEESNESFDKETLFDEISKQK